MMVWVLNNTFITAWQSELIDNLILPFDSGGQAPFNITNIPNDLYNSAVYEYRYSNAAMVINFTLMTILFLIKAKMYTAIR